MFTKLTRCSGDRVRELKRKRYWERRDHGWDGRQKKMFTTEYGSGHRE